MNEASSRREVRTLLVEDEPNMVRTLQRILSRKGYDVDSAGNGAEALEKLGRQRFDLVITDLNMPVVDGMELLREMSARGLQPATIVLTGHGTVSSAVEAMKLGAGDYLIKPCSPDELLIVAERLLELRSLRREVGELRRRLGGLAHFGELIGSSPAMQEVYRVIDAVSRNKSSVLVTGENGTGKELVARTIHGRSALADAPFLAINCGALSATLLESQLFGHRRGSFTGAIEDHEGLFQAASGGTLFLDEIAEVPLELQVKFLRAIQEREVTPLGSNQPAGVVVRILAARNRDREAAVVRGEFRADLFYRLNVVPIHLPPLRERRDDLTTLVEHFVREFSAAYGVEPKHVEPEASAAMQAYDWPGNIRELQNAIERAFALSSEPVIRRADLPPAVTGFRRQPTGSQVAWPLPFDEAERANIAAALSKAGGNKNEAARILGIDRQRLYRKIDKYDLDGESR